ncbi:MAG: hypothetical protein HY293_01180, partial [Planctomycetes bacterium]|nr:hypothetical protein [Planctomycetota bacterium]
QAGPAGPTLPLTLTFRHNDYEETGGTLPITGTLELIIEPSGEARAACRRQILTDVERSDPLTREQLTELVARVEAWTSKAADLPPGTGKNHGFISYGAKKAAWAKDAPLPPELKELVTFLLTIPPTLRVNRKAPKPS